MVLTRFTYFFPCLRQPLNFIRKRVRDTESFLIEGVVKNTDYSATTLFVGPRELAHKLSCLMYSEFRECALGKCMLYQVDPFRLPLCEITAVCMEDSLKENFREQDYLFLPYVNFSLDLTFPISEILKRSSKRRRRDIKKIEKIGYSYTIVKDSEDNFDFFYKKMYLPYTKKRFGKTARVADYSILKRIYKAGGGVIFVKNEDLPLSGILFQIRGKTIYALHSGVYNGDQSIVRRLASQAALLFLVKWARSKGLTCLDYGSTLPFFNDGAFSYKKGWGMHLENDPFELFCALKLIPNRGTLSFLQQNPCIFKYEGTINGLFLVDHKPTEEFKQYFKKYYFPKLDSITLIAYYRTKVSYDGGQAFSTRRKNSTSIKPIRTLCSSLRKLNFEVETCTITATNAVAASVNPKSEERATSVMRNTFGCERLG